MPTPRLPVLARIGHSTCAFPFRDDRPHEARRPLTPLAEQHLAFGGGALASHEDRLVLRATSSTSSALGAGSAMKERAPASPSVLCERSNEWRRVTLLVPGTGEPTRVSRVRSEPVLRGEGCATSDLRFGRFWVTGPRAASPDAVDRAVFDPASGEALWANGEVKIQRRDVGESLA